jgi:hypothetical protein
MTRKKMVIRASLTQWRRSQRRPPDRQLVLPQPLVAIREGAVGQEQGSDGGGQQHRSADGLDAQELHHWVQDATDLAGAPSKGHRGLQ